MKKISLLLILFFYLQNIFLQANCDITQYYDDFIKVAKNEWEGKTYLDFKVLDSLETKKCYNKLLTNSWYIEYLMLNFSSNRETHKYLHEIKDTASIEYMQKILIQRLQQDTKFNTVMMDFVDKTINEKTLKDTITVKFLMNIASKYFKVVGFNEENNRYLVKFCVGIHGIEDTELKRNPFVEAFAWAYTANKFGSPEIVKIRQDMHQELNSINLGIGVNNEEGILRAQGALYYIMSKNKDYEKFLLEEYQANKDILPFVILN